MWAKAGELKELMDASDQFYEDYKEGKTLKKISKEQKIPLKELKYILIGRKYADGASAAELEAEFGVSVRTIHDQLDVLGLVKHRKEKGKETSPTDSEIRKKERQALGDEGKKIVTVAFGLGGPQARKNLLLIDHMMKSGNTLEMIGDKWVDWWKMKVATEAHMAEQDVTIENQGKENSELRAIAMPNFRHERREARYMDLAWSILRLQALGVEVELQPYLEALENDLLALERDIYAAVIDPEDFSEIKETYHLTDKDMNKMVEIFREKIKAVKVGSQLSEKPKSVKPGGLRVKVPVITG